VSRGHQRERDVVNLLREKGYWAIRSPASKGNVDVVAIREGPTFLTEVRFIEVKSTAAGPYSHFLPSHRKALSEAASLAGASAELCWWPPRKPPQFIPEDEWPN
jgi:Holliday junction resolvase